MNGYGSQALSRPMVLSRSQQITKIVWPARNRPVPRNLAMASDIRPNTSASYREPIRRVDPRGTASSARSVRSRVACTSVASLSPVRRQQPVEYVVHRHGTYEPSRLVADRNADQVVGRQPGRDLTFRQISPDIPAALDALSHRG